MISSVRRLWWKFGETARCVILASLIFTIQILTIGTHAHGREPVSKQAWLDDLDYMISYLEKAHPNLYRNVSKESVYGRVKELKEKIPTMQDKYIPIEFMELVASFEDGHTSLWPIPQIFSGFNVYPIRFNFFSDGLYVQAIEVENKDYVGMKVLRIGDKSAEDAVELVSRVISADNISGKKRHLHLYLSVAEVLHHYKITNSVNKLNVILGGENGEKRTLQLESRPFLEIIRTTRLFAGFFPVADASIATMNDDAAHPVPLYKKNQRDNYWFEYLGNHEAFYVQVNRMIHAVDESFDDFVLRVFKAFDGKKAKRMIIDIRFNEGGNHLEVPLIKEILARPKLDRADNLFLLTSRNTFSASQHLTSVMERYTNVTIVGEPTAGKPVQDGSTRIFALPNSGITIERSHFHYIDTDPCDYRPSTTPDILVESSSDEYRSNKDPVLDIILDENGFSPLPDLLACLKSEYLNGGRVVALRKYTDLKPAFDGRNGNTEKAIDEFAYWLYEENGDFETALQFFKINLDDYPDSFVVYNSIGEYYLDSKKYREAKPWFEKSLELSPGHSIPKRNLAIVEMELSAE